MEKMNMKKVLMVLIHAFVGWAWCGAVMGIGMKVTTIEAALIIHAIGGPLGFIVISLIYLKKFNYTTPLQTAIIFLLFVFLMDFFVVALLIQKSLEMFASLLGVWIPFALIFLVTYVTGLITGKKQL